MEMESGDENYIRSCISSSLFRGSESVTVSCHAASSCIVSRYPLWHQTPISVKRCQGLVENVASEDDNY